METKSMKRLKQYKEKFEIWNDDRIKHLYDKLQDKNILTFHITSLETQTQVVKEIVKINSNITQSQAFVDNMRIETVNIYLLTFWEEIESSVIVANNKDDYTNFKNWFEGLLGLDMDFSGLLIDNKEYFIVELNELENRDGYSFGEMWACLEDEDLI